MNSAAPDAFLFDLDGTLVDSERENIESVVLAVRRHGAELSAEERQFVIGHSWNEIYEMVARNHSLPVTMTQLIAEAVDEKRELVAVSGPSRAARRGERGETLRADVEAGGRYGRQHRRGHGMRSRASA